MQDTIKLLRFKLVRDAVEKCQAHIGAGTIARLAEMQLLLRTKLRPFAPGALKGGIRALTARRGAQ